MICATLVSMSWKIKWVDTYTQLLSFYLRLSVFSIFPDVNI